MSQVCTHVKMSKHKSFWLTSAGPLQPGSPCPAVSQKRSSTTSDPSLAWAGLEKRQKKDKMPHNENKSVPRTITKTLFNSHCTVQISIPPRRCNVNETSADDQWENWRWDYEIHTWVMWNNLPSVFRTATRAATGRRAKAPWEQTDGLISNMSSKCPCWWCARKSACLLMFCTEVLTTVIVMGGYKRAASWDCCHASHLVTVP